MTNLEVVDWGLIDYQEALEKQLALVERVAEDSSLAPGYLIFCTHPPIVTLGRATKEGDVQTWSGPVIEISRGGRATYHGPSQLVIYPIVNLKIERRNRKAQEVHGFLRDFEEAIVKVLNDYGLQGQGRSLQKKLNTEFMEEETGVWLGHRKLASLGLAIKKWVTFHGAAVNVDLDPTAFQGLKPCGFSPSTMISLEEALKHKVDRQELQKKLIDELLKKL